MTRWALIRLIPLLVAGCARFEPKELVPAQSAEALRGRSLDAPGLMGFVRTNLSPSPTEGAPSVWNLEALTLAGIYHHPGLAVAQAQWATALAGIRTAKGRPNPVLGVTPGYNFTTVGSGPGAVATPWFPFVNLDWPIETAGKRGYRQARARHAAESARLAVAQMAWQVRNAVRTALLEVAYSEARTAILAELADSGSQLVEVSQLRLDAGAVSVLEASRLRVAGNRARLDLLESRRLAALARTFLAEALGLPAEALRTVKLDYPLVPGAPPGTPQDEAAWRDAALQGRADVLGALADFAASQAALQLEIARQYPDVHLGNGYQYDQGNHKWTLGLTFELPVLNQNQGPIAEARARRREAVARFNAVQARALAQIEQALASHGLARAGFDQAGVLNASQAEAERAAEVNFGAGASDRLEVLTARLELSTAKLALLDAAYRVQQALGQLETAVQRPLSGSATLMSIPTSLPTP